MGPGVFNTDQIRAATFVRHVEIHDSLGSTNVRAAELAGRTDIDLPALVVARHQTAGKGRGSNTWWSAEGALTFSVLLEPTEFGISTAEWPQLSLATAVAVCDALGDQLRESGGPSRASAPLGLGIKWPNDVMIDGSKVCGILIESPGGAAPAKDRLIIGVGINVNNSWRTAPHEVGPGGTALCDASGTMHNLQTTLIRALGALRKRFTQLADDDPGLHKAWQQLCWLTEQGVDVETHDRVISGFCVGIDTDGALVVEDESGLHRVLSGSVRVL